MASLFEGGEIKPLYVIDISSKWGSEYVGYIHDLLRMVILQVTIQLMFVMLDSERYCFFTQDFGVTLLFIILGVSVYWLVFKKFVSIK